MRGVAGLIVLLGVEDDIARRGGKRNSVVAGRCCDPSLHQRGNVDHDKLLRRGGRKGGQRRAQRGNRRIGHRGFAPRAGDRQHTDQAGNIHPVQVELHSGLADLRRRGARGQRGEVELNQRRAAVAHIEVRQAAIVGGWVGAVHIRIPRYSGIRGVRRARYQNHPYCRQTLHPDPLAHRSSPD